MASSPLRRLFARLLAVILSLLVVLLALEVGTRLFSDVVPPLKVKNPRFGDHYQPGFSGQVFVGEAGRKVALRFNEDGFRGDDFDLEAGPKTQRVAVLGDSMIAAVAVDEKDTLVAQLRQQLSTQTSTKWQVMNFGVSGASPGQSMVLYRELVRKYRPQVVINTLFIGNDLSDSSSEIDHYPRIYFKLDPQGKLVQEPFSVRKAKLSGYLNRYSRFYVWQKVRVNKLLHQAQVKTYGIAPGHWIYFTGKDEKAERAWKILSATLAEFKKTVEADGARYILAVLPSGRQIYPEGFEVVRKGAAERADFFDPNYPQRRIGEITKQHGIETIYLAELLRSITQGRSVTKTPPKDLLYFRGSGHFTERGQQVAAEEIYRRAFAKTATVSR